MHANIKNVSKYFIRKSFGRIFSLISPPPLLAAPLMSNQKFKKMEYPGTIIFKLAEKNI
jgi:hypothetical protein